MAELKNTYYTLGGLPDERGFSTSRRGSEVSCKESIQDELIYMEPPIGSLMDYEEFLRNCNSDEKYRKFAIDQGWSYYLKEAIVVTNPLEVQVFNDYKKSQMATQFHRDPHLLENNDPLQAQIECKMTYGYLKDAFTMYDYYAVLVPYKSRKGMTMEQVYNMVKRRWAPKRLCITYEDRDKLGNRINPHYNILLSTNRELKSYNCNNINVEVRNVMQYRTLQNDYEVLFDYIFKTYFKPVRRECIERTHYMVQDQSGGTYFSQVKSHC